MMNPSAPEHAIRIAELLDVALAQIQAGEPIDVAALQALHPDLANELPALLETLRDLDTAADNWKCGNTLDERDAPTGSHASVSSPAAVVLRLEKVGRYHILARLGAGGMGTVYKAEDPQLHRVVAVKIPNFDKSRPDPAVSVQRFLREARAAAQVRHPHICPIHDVGEQDGTPYAVMAYIEGTSLAEFLKHEPLNEARAVELVRKVALGLEAVHAQGIIHRDLKPGNILLDHAGEPLLTDFGLALPDKDAEHLTQEGAVLGTPAYMAPEQARGESARIGPWTDVYSLGVVLYQLLTSRLPFEGPPLSILFKIVHDPLPPLSSLQPDVDPALEAIVLRAMARRPEDRYQSAREFAGALEVWSAQPKNADAGRSPSSLSEKAAERAPPITAPKRRRWASVFAVAAAVFLLVGGGLLVPQIIIRIRDPQGNEKIVEAAKGSKITIEEKNLAPVPFKLPGGDDKLKPKPVVIKPGQTPVVDLQATVAEHTEGVTHLAVSQDGTKVLTYSSDSMLWFWELAAEKNEIQLVWKLKVDKLLSLALDSNGSHALLAIDGNVNLSQVDTKTQQMQDKPGRAPVAFSPVDDRRYLAVPSIGGFSLNDRVDGQTLRQFSGDGQYNRMLQFCLSRDGKRILSLGTASTVQLWDSSSGANLKQLPRLALFTKLVVALSPDAKQALISQGGVLQLWDLSKGEVIGELKGHDEDVMAVAFGPDGSWAVSASRDKTLRVWELPSGNELDKLERHKDDVACVAVTSQGRIVSASRDKTLRVWKWDPKDPISQPPPPLKKEVPIALAPWPDLRASVVLDLTTKLGVNARVKVKRSDQGYETALEQISRTAPPKCAKLALDLGNSVYVFIPLHVVKKVASQDKEHVVTLIDGSTYTGTILTTVADEDGKTHVLASVSQMVVVGAKDAKPPAPEKPLVLLRVPKPLDKTFAVYPPRIWTDDKGAGESFKITVDGESLQGNLSDFARLVMAPRGGGDWNFTVQLPEAAEKTGVFHMPNRWWWLQAEMPNGCLVVISSHGNSVGFAIEKNTR